MSLSRHQQPSDVVDGRPRAGSFRVDPLLARLHQIHINRNCAWPDCTPENVRPIIADVCERRAVEIVDFFSASRKAPIVHARQEAARIVREKLKLSLPKIGAAFGRHHTTILHALRRASARGAE